MRKDCQLPAVGRYEKSRIAAGVLMSLQAWISSGCYLDAADQIKTHKNGHIPKPESIATLSVTVLILPSQDPGSFFQNNPVSKRYDLC